MSAKTPWVTPDGFAELIFRLCVLESDEPESMAWSTFKRHLYGPVLPSKSTGVHSKLLNALLPDEQARGRGMVTPVHKFVDNGVADVQNYADITWCDSELESLSSACFHLAGEGYVDTRVTERNRRAGTRTEGTGLLHYKAKLNGLSSEIFVDGGSQRSHISAWHAHRLGCTLEELPDSSDDPNQECAFTVKAAFGKEVKCTQVLRQAQFKVGDFKDRHDLYVLPMLPFKPGERAYER